MKRITKAFLISPLSLVPVIYISAFYFPTLKGTVGTAAGNAAVNGLMVTSLASLFALPVAYLWAGIFGIPYYLLLKRCDKLSLKYFFAGSFIAGAFFPVASVLLDYWLMSGIVPKQRGLPFRYNLPMPYSWPVNLLWFGCCGMVVAYAIWYLGIRGSDAKI